MSARSFTSAAATKPPLIFDVDGEEFTAIPVLPATATLGLVALTEAQSNIDRAKAVTSILDEVLVPESAERFAARMRGGDKPLGLSDALQVVTWLLSELVGTGADRPLDGDSPSPSGLLSDGPTSTDGAPPEA